LLYGTPQRAAYALYVQKKGRGSAAPHNKREGSIIMPEKKPFITLEQAQEIIADVPTPFHLYDEKGIRANARLVNKAFAWNKGFKEYFAVKATPNPYLLRILKEEGCGVDCSSYTELLLSEACGFSGSDIMFSSNDTPEKEFKYADEIGGIINLDDITHIESVERALGRIPEVISCRYNPGGVFKISNGIMDNPGDAKYGMTTEQIFDAFRILKSKGAKEFGIHAFLASNTVTNDYYPMLAKVMFELAVKLQKETGAHIKFINLSGGIGIPYKPDQEPNDIRVIGEGVRKVYEEVLVPEGMGDVAIYTELGRFMMGPYGCLVTKAIHEKHTHKEYIGVDACAVNLMRPAMYGAYHHITVMGKENEPCDHKYDVTGSLCENNDKFAIDRMLPKIDMGDLLVIHDAGAHGFAMGYNYNGKLKSAEILLHEDGSFEMIRRAETPRDYFATFDCFPVFEKLLQDEDELK
jgi:diaminopimelate decarboxylase